METLSDLKALQALMLAHSKADTVLDQLKRMQPARKDTGSGVDFSDLNALLLQMREQASDKQDE